MKWERVFFNDTINGLIKKTLPSKKIVVHQKTKSEVGDSLESSNETEDLEQSQSIVHQGKKKKRIREKIRE